jgi:predicted RNase H-like HicB family nuclease
MFRYHTAYYRGDKGWIVGQVLDFPDAASQGRTLKSARKMLRDALREMAEALMEDGQPLPTPKPKARDRKAIFREDLTLLARVPKGDTDETTQTIIPWTAVTCPTVPLLWIASPVLAPEPDAPARETGDTSIPRWRVGLRAAGSAGPLFALRLRP